MCSLRLFLVKLHIRTPLTESLLTTYDSWSCAKKSCFSHQFTPFANWRMTKGCFHHLVGHRVSSEVRLENYTQVLGVRKIWRACDPQLKKKSASHLFGLIQTLPNQSTPVHNTMTMYACRAMLIFALLEGFCFSVLCPLLLQLHNLARLIESFPTVYSLWSCIEIKMSIPLGAIA